MRQLARSARSFARLVVSGALALTLVGGFVALDGAASPAHASPSRAAVTGQSSAVVKSAATAAAGDGWFTSWAQSQDRRSGITFTDQTFRMVTHLSQGGDELRVRLQNQYGAGPLTVDASAVALSSGGAATVDDTNHPLEFAGQSSVRIPVGGQVWSDSVELQTTAQDDIAVSMYVKGPLVPSLHSSPYRDNYVSAEGSGDKVGEASAEPFGKTMPWTYLVSAVDVHNTDLTGTIVAYGSSVVDGEGSQNCGQGCTATGTDRRWSDDLARRINSELPADAQVAVANEGIGGTTSSPVCAGGGNDGEHRLDRDVLALHGVTGVIFYYGTNDLANTACTDLTIIDSYKTIFHRLRDAGIKVYVTPITPRPSYTAQQNAYRSTVGAFVRAGGNCSGTCDAVLDFDAVLKDPANANSIYPPFDNGDGVHANVAGQQAIANSISLPLLASAGLADGAPLPVLKTPSKYDFEDGFQGWQAGSGVGSVQWVDGFANGPKTPFEGKRAMDALSRSVPANQFRTLFVEPPKPLDLTDSKALVARIDSYGGLVGATGYEAAITLTGAGGDVLTKNFPTSSNKWNELSLDVSGWAARGAVSKIEIGFRALGQSSIWVPHFQIDDIAWPATQVAPKITSGDPGAATVGTAYSFTVIASGTPAPTFSVTKGGLPLGLSLDKTTGVISGMPKTAGTAAFTVSAGNDVGSDATADYTITVTAGPSAPMITPGEPAAATVGSKYSFTVAASGSPAPTFSVTDGTLPDGLGLDKTTGVISGTPTTAGSAEFTITAGNQVGADATADYTITVHAAATGPSDPAGPAGPAANAGANGAQHPLADTGSNLAPLGALAAVLALLGAALVLLRRRPLSRR